MKRLFILSALFLFCYSATRAVNLSDSYKATLSSFQTPEVSYSSCPFFVWNGKMTKGEIENYLKDYQSKGIQQVFIHPRPGMITTYLTDEWFGLFSYTVELAKTMGMKVWIYDENSYPSGFAGGGVPATLPGSKGKSLFFYRVTAADSIQNPWAVYQKKGGSYVETNTKNHQKGEYLVAELKEWNNTQWFGGFSYVDIMQKKVTEKFIDLTVKEYQKRYGADFGKTIPGIFMDEPNVQPNWSREISVHYTPALFEAFTKKWGYDLRSKLPLLFEDVADYRKVRHDFYSVILDLFINNWAIPYSDYCTENNLALTGHYWDHEWPNPAGVPDNMALTAFSTQPGIDLLFNNWYTGYSAQFGNSRMVRELRSVANQMGRARTLSETYGGSGWDLTFKDQKRILDWECALGVNFVNQHLSHQTIVGARKRDYPQSFSYHEPWWDNYKTMADYISRLSVAMSKGIQRNKILVIEPTTTGWMNYSRTWSPYMSVKEGWKAGKTGQLCDVFHTFIGKLEFHQVEYDLGCEDMMKRFGSVKGTELLIGQASYNLVILPPGMENLDKETVGLLGKYLTAGGKVLTFSGIPAYVDGEPSTLLNRSITKQTHWIKADTEKMAESIFAMNHPAVSFSTNEVGSLIFHQTRELDNARLVFIANVRDSFQTAGTFTSKGGSVEQWNLFTGQTEAYPFKSENGKVTISYQLPAAGSILLCIKDESKTTVSNPSFTESVIPFADSVVVKRLFPNVLTLDYCDLKLNGKTTENLYVPMAAMKVLQSFGFKDNPWNGVQYKDGTIKTDTFKTNSGFEADFPLTIGEGVDVKNLKIVSERPGIFKVKVNGKVVEPATGEWWLEKGFAVYKAGELLKPGVNTITLSVSPMSIYAELESIYITGDFSTQPQPTGFKLIPQQDLKLGSWTKAGMYFYGNKVSYSHSCDLKKDKGKRYFVRLNSWRGTVCDVLVNGTKAGIIAWDPYELDITGWIKTGTNDVQVQVCGSLYNTLGPHHNTSKLGMVDPGKFVWFKEGKTLRGDDYNFIEYGLFRDFELVVR